MIKQSMKKALHHFGYDIQRIKPSCAKISRGSIRQPPAIAPIWPLPRRPGGPSNEEIRKEFTKYEFWHYAYRFDGGLSFNARHNVPGQDDPDRPVQRFRHFMPYVIDAQHGSLQGKRILDIACNSGFWSIQCALLGAQVIGFDARPELIEQANLIKSIVGLDNVEFRVFDFWDMNPRSLGGTFDVVLNLGILYHLPKPLEALELTKSMTHKNILVDTTLHPTDEPVMKVQWEEPIDIAAAAGSGIIALPSKAAIDMMLKHIGVAESFEIPIRTVDMPHDYLTNRRATWLITV